MPQIYSLEMLKEIGIEPMTYDSHSDDTATDNAENINKLKLVLNQMMRIELTEKERETVLQHMCGFTFQTIADYDKISKVSVCRRYHTAINKLKKRSVYIMPFL